MSHSIELLTPRLILVGAESALLITDQLGQTALSVAIGAKVPSSWPPEHHDKDVIDWLLQTTKTLDPTDLWRMFYMVLRAPRTVVGTCGFRGPPDLQGVVEVGYSVLPEFRCSGLASEAVTQLIDAAFDRGALEVVAETYPTLTASLRVMHKCGMTLIGNGADEGTVRYSITHQ